MAKGVNIGMVNNLQQAWKFQAKRSEMIKSMEVLMDWLAGGNKGKIKLK